MFKLNVSETARQWLVLISMCISVFGVAYTTTAVMNSLVTMGTDLNITPNNMQWIINGYTLATSVLIIVAGQVGQLFSYRKAFYSGALVFLVTSIYIALAHSGTGVIIARFIQGAGAAFITPLTIAMIKFNFQGERTKTAIAIWTAVVSLGFSLGPVLGGIFTSLVSWRLLFWLSVILITIGSAVLMITPNRPQSCSSEETIKLDFYGLILLVISLIPLILGLVEGNVWGWTNWITWSLIVAGLILLVIFYIVENKVNSPMVHFVHFKKMIFCTALAGQACTMMCMFAVLYFFNVYVQTSTLLNYSPIMAGVAILPMSLLIFIVSFLSPIVMRKFGYRAPITISFIVAAIGFYLLHNVTVNVSYGDLWPGLVLIGLAIGNIYAAFSGLVLSALPAEAAGEASGILTMDMYLSVTVGTAISVIVFTAASRDAIHNVLNSITNISVATKHIIDKAILGHSMSIQALEQHVRPEFKSDIVQISQQAATHGFSAAMMYGFVFAIIGAIVSAVFIRITK